jgi:ATP-dependent protease ClpP protease subunit
MSEIPQANEVHGIFAGGIDTEAVRRIANALSVAMGNNVTHVHLMLQSGGGIVGDGICLYNIFRSLPIDLTLYNCGTVASIAAVAYVGAKRRKTSAHATFMIHRTQVQTQFASAGRLERLTQGALIDDDRIEAILNEHITLTEDQRATHRSDDLWLSAKDAVQAGLADEIGEFAPPLGRQVFFI